MLPRGTGYALLEKVWDVQQPHVPSEQGRNNMGHAQPFLWFTEKTLYNETGYGELVNTSYA